MKYILLLGRILFSFIFLATIMSHFSAPVIAYAGMQGVPMPNILVPLSAIIAAAGAISLILGYKAKAGAWLIVLFLVPVTLYMHRFWTISDPAMMQMQMSNFMKNMSLLGCAFIITYFGAGPLSLDARAHHHHSEEDAASDEAEHKHKSAA